MEQWQSNVDARLASLEVNVHDLLPKRVRDLEKIEYIRDSPFRRRLVWIIDGWPWRRYVERPQWRPWRRWWTS